MVSQKTTVVNKTGLHLRPAAELSTLCGKYACDIKILVEGKAPVNPKSVLILMAAEITKGTDIEVVCEGADEEAALAAIIEAIESGLGEGVE